MECKTVIIKGDINLDRLKPENKEGQLLLHLEEIYDLKCLITEPTRVTPTSSTLLEAYLKLINVCWRPPTLC